MKGQQIPAGKIRHDQLMEFACMDSEEPRSVIIEAELTEPVVGASEQNP